MGRRGPAVTVPTLSPTPTPGPAPAPTLSLTISGLHRTFGADHRVIVEVARIAEDVGIDQVVLPDHVVMSANVEPYPYGDFPFPPGDPWVEPLTTLAAIAGATATVRLGTGVLITPLRPAVLLAKTVATLDNLSCGRVDLGVGLGWQREEYDAVGVPWARRWSRHDDTIRACRALWAGRGEPVTFHSDTVSFDGIWCEPAPVQETVPIWFGAKATPALAVRLAEQGDGWLPLGRLRPEDVVAESAVLREAFVAAGRDPATLGIRVGLPLKRAEAGGFDLPASMDRVTALIEAGATSFSVNPPAGADSTAAIGRHLEAIAGAFPR